MNSMFAKWDYNIIYGEYHDTNIFLRVTYHLALNHITKRQDVDVDIFGKLKTHIPSHAALNIDIHDIFNNEIFEKKLVNSLQQNFKRYAKNISAVNGLVSEKIVFIEGL